MDPRGMNRLSVFVAALAVVCLSPPGMCRRVSTGVAEAKLSSDGRIVKLNPPSNYPPDVVLLSREDIDDTKAEIIQAQTTEIQPTPEAPRGRKLPITSDSDRFPHPDDLQSTNSRKIPLIEQENLSTKFNKKKYENVIQGSRNAFTITKIEYLRKERCKTERLRQVIRMDGCLKRTIMNKFCYGQCNSFFIPKSGARGKNTAAFQSCSFCKPRRTAWVTVKFTCPRKGNKPPRIRRKKVQMIKSCKCMAQQFS